MAELSNNRKNDYLKLLNLNSLLFLIFNYINTITNKSDDDDDTNNNNSYYWEIIKKWDKLRIFITEIKMFILKKNFYFLYIFIFNLVYIYFATKYFSGNKKNKKKLQQKQQQQQQK